MTTEPALASPPPSLPPRLLRIAVAYISVMGVLSVIGTALSPYLLVKSPLALLALNADARHLVLVAGQVDPWLAMPVSVLRRTLGMFSTYAFGAIWGAALVHRMGRRWRWLGATMDWIERLFARLGLPLLVVVPSYTLCLLGGASRLPWRPFLLAITIGQVLTSAALLWFGDQVSGWTQLVLAFLERHLLASTLVAIGLVLIQQLAQRRGGRGAQG